MLGNMSPVCVCMRFSQDSGLDMQNLVMQMLEKDDSQKFL
jgi:hypothetical protein